MPRVLVPQINLRPPDGAHAQVDWRQPINRGLIACYLPIVTDYHNRIPNLAGGQAMPYEPGRAVSPAGLAYDPEFGRATDWAVERFETTQGLIGFPAAGYPLTLSAWARPLSAATNQSFIGVKRAYSSTELFCLATRTTGRWDLHGHDSVTNVDCGLSTGITYSAGVWYHVVGVVYSDGSMALYVDGVQQDTNAGRSWSFTSTPNLAGIGDPSGHGWWTKGPVKAACIWNRALSDAEIASLYERRTRWRQFVPVGMRAPLYLPDTAAVSRGGLWSAGLQSPGLRSSRL